MAYQVPQALVFQQRNTVAAPTQRVLAAHISGGLAQLVRFAEDDERADGFLDYYDPLVDASFDWPSRVAGGLIDEDYTKVFIKDALLSYFDDDLSSGDTISTVEDYANRLVADTLAFRANGAAYPRSDEFLDRDVAVGDIAKVRAVVGSDAYELWTYVAGFMAEVVAAVTAAAAADGDNAATQSAPSPTDTQSAGAENCVVITDVDQTSYDGLVDGDINETYTITVVESSVDGDATTAVLRVQSASGNDDVEDVTPAAFGDPTEIGTRGLTVTWDNTSGSECSDAAIAEGVSPIDFIAGQQFVVECGQAFTATTPTSSGTYTGTADTTYIVEVTRGGLYADTDAPPQITVSTTTGIDLSGPTNVTSTSAVAIGTYGAQIALSGTRLRKGDRFLVAVTAATEGRISTLKLGHSLPQEVIDNGATEVSLSLYIKVPELQVTANRIGSAPLTNWDQSATEITLNSGITAFHESWTDGGTPVALSVISESSKSYGGVYVEYRAWRSDYCGDVYTCATDDDYADIPGPSHPDNPLKYGVLKARANSNGLPVRWSAVCDPSDSESWEEVLSLLDGRDDVYGLVPLTRDRAIWNLYEAHVVAQSSATNGRWRQALFALEGMPEKALVTAATSEDSEVVLATVLDDPDTSGTQYTLVRVPAANADFVTNGVQAGDIVRLLYTTDGFGNESYTERVVDAVINEDTLRLRSGLDAAVNVAAKIEVWRNLTPTAEATELATHGFSNLRVSLFWPDTIEDGDYVLPGYFVCCAFAGLQSGVVPQQGLTNVAINGFSSVTRSTRHFRSTQLDILAASGINVVTQDRQTGAIFSRHAITTAPYDQLYSREEVLVRNPDDTSYYFLDLLRPLVGKTNITPQAINSLRVQLESGIAVLRTRNFVATLGGQVTDCTVESIAQSTVLLDHLVIVLVPTYPIPLNNPELYLVIG